MGVYGRLGDKGQRYGSVSNIRVVELYLLR